MTSAYWDIARLAWRNVRRNWRHSLATILAIASGFMAIALFDGFLRELEFQNFDGYTTRGMLGQVIIQREGADKHLDEDQWAYALDAQDQAFLADFFAKDAAFVRRVRFLSLSGMVTMGSRNAVVVGYGYDVADGEAMRGERWRWDAMRGVPLAATGAPSIMLAPGLAELLGCQFDKNLSITRRDGGYIPEPRPFQCPRPRLTLSATTEAAQVNTIDLAVVGTFDASFREADLKAIRLGLVDAQKLLDTDKVTLVSVQLRAESEAKAFIQRLQMAAAAAGRPIAAAPWYQHRLAVLVQGGMEILHVFRNLFMLVVVGIAVMSVTNTMMKAVNERLREIGTLRSLGFYRQHITSLFALEGALMSALASALGLVLTLAISRVINLSGITYKAGFLSTPVPLAVRDAPAAWLWSALILSALAMGASWVCARRAARMVVADALRSV